MSSTLTPPHRSRRFPRLTGAVLLVIVALFAFGSVKAQVRPDDRTLLDAWALAERAGQYRFTSQVSQTTIPAPCLANVGQTVRKNHLTVQGAINRRSDTLQLSFWDNPATAFDPKAALEVVIERGVAQGRVQGGEWQPLEDFGDAFAPGGDVAAYLLRRAMLPTWGRRAGNCRHSTTRSPPTATILRSTALPSPRTWPSSLKPRCTARVTPSRHASGFRRRVPPDCRQRRRMAGQRRPAAAAASRDGIPGTGQRRTHPGQCPHRLH